MYRRISVLCSKLGVNFLNLTLDVKLLLSSLVCCQCSGIILSSYTVERISFCACSFGFSCCRSVATTDRLTIDTYYIVASGKLLGTVYDSKATADNYFITSLEGILARELGAVRTSIAIVYSELILCGAIIRDVIFQTAIVGVIATCVYRHNLTFYILIGSCITAFIDILNGSSHVEWVGSCTCTSRFCFLAVATVDGRQVIRSRNILTAAECHGCHSQYKE